MQSILKAIHTDSSATADGAQIEPPLQLYTEQMEKEESKVPQNNLFRDGTMNEHLRDIKYYSGKAIELDERRRLLPSDFREEYPCYSRAENHIKAAALKRDADYTDSYEMSAQHSDNNFFRMILLRQETMFGLYYVEHLIKSIMKEPANPALIRRLCTVAVEWNGRLKGFLQDITDDRHGWLRDLITLLAAICRSCPTVEEQVAAINTSLVEMALKFSSAANILPSAALGVKTRSVLSSICKEILQNMCEIAICTDNTRGLMQYYADQPGVSQSMYFSSLRDVLQSRDGF